MAIEANTYLFTGVKLIRHRYGPAYKSVILRTMDNTVQALQVEVVEFHPEQSFYTMRRYKALGIWVAQLNPHWSRHE